MPGTTLVCGYRSGDFTDELLAKNPVIQVFDAYHAAAIEKKWQRSVTLAPHVPAGPFAEAYLKTGPKLMNAELQLDQLQEIYAALEEGGTLHVTYEGFEADALAALRKAFSQVKKVKGDKHVLQFEAKKAGPLKRVRSFACEWPASVPGGEKLMFTSFPGCFCHRRVDEGGLALAEVVCAREAKAGAALRLLDMGCGCGLVGLLIADALRQANAAVADAISSAGVGASSLTLLDSHTRAIEAAQVNAAKFGLAAEFLTSANGVPRDRDHLRAYDVFVGNPPYYSDYRIAEVFLETAWAALKPGGRCYTVVKTASGLKPLQEKYFRKVEVINRRNYAVLRSIR